MKPRVAAIFAVLIVSALMMSLASCGGESARSGEISLSSVAQADGVSSVLLNSRGTKLTVRALLSDTFLADNPRATVSLFELGAGQNAASIANLEPVHSYRASSKASWSAPLREGSATRLYCSYILAAENGEGGYTPIGAPVPILNPEVLATRNFDYPTPLSIKGLESSSVSDALSLGVSQVVLDIKIEDYIVIPDPSDRTTLSAVSYEYNGITYHFSAAALTALDGKVRILTDESVVVYFRFTLETHPSSLPERLSCLGHSDAADARGYAISPFMGDCAGYMAALFELFSERYTRPGGEFGFCGSFIIGSDVNNASVSYSAGADTSAEENLAAYERLVRIARTALVSNYSGGRVYISLGRNWNTELEGAGMADSSSFAFLTRFSTLAAASGDYNWGVAASASALDPLDSSIWDDALASGASSQYLSPTNINVLTYALSKNFTFAGSMRNTIICSFGVLGDPSLPSSLPAQAASYAFAYYKAAADSAILALIYSTLDDTQDDTLKYGLRASPTGQSKPIWDVFASIDTLGDDAVGAVAPIAGSEFSYLYQSASNAVKVKSSFTGESRSDPSGGKHNRTPLFDFTKGNLSGFSLVSSSGVLDLWADSGKPALHIVSLGEAGIANTTLEGYALNDAKYLLVNLSSSGAPGTITLRISQNAKGGYLSYQSSAEYSGEHQIFFDISELSEAIAASGANISLWFRPDEPGAKTELTISAIETASQKASAAPILWILFLSLAIMFGLLMLVALFSRVFHRIKRRQARRTSRGGSLTKTDGD